MAGRRKTYTFAEAFAIITSDSGATVVPLESSSDVSDLLLPELDTDNSDSEVWIPSLERYVISVIDYLLIWCQIDDLFTLLDIIYRSPYSLYSFHTLTTGTLCLIFIFMILFASIIIINILYIVYLILSLSFLLFIPFCIVERTWQTKHCCPSDK